jgi:hypothetical protein
MNNTPKDIDGKIGLLIGRYLITFLSLTFANTVLAVR